jgi:hypothetical protein
MSETVARTEAQPAGESLLSHRQILTILSGHSAATALDI